MLSPKFVQKEDVLIIHDELINLYGGSSGIRDEGLLESAIYQLQATFGGEFLYPTIVEQAVAYLLSIVKNHAFVDSNKRVAFAATVTFLNINDYELNMTQKEAEKLTLQVADSTINREELIEILKNHISEFI